MSESDIRSRAAGPRELAYLAGAVALAAFLRLLAIGLRKGYLGFDESMYIVLGKNLLSGAGYRLNGLPNATFPFGVPLIAGSFYTLTGSARWALSLPTVLFGALGVLPVYLIAREIWDRLSGATAALLYAAFPPLLFLVPWCDYGDRLYAGSEAIFIFFVLAAGYACLRAMGRQSVGTGLALGFFSGAAFEVRQDALGYFAAFLGILYLYCAVRDRKILHKGALAAAAAAAAVFVILAFPYLLWVKHVTGRFSLGPRFAKTFQMRDSLEEIARGGEWGGAHREYFAANPDNSQLETPYYGVAPYHREKYASGAYNVSLSELAAGLRGTNLRRAWQLLWRKLMPRASWVVVVVGLVSALKGRKWRLLLVVSALAAPSAFVAMTLYGLARFHIVFAAGLLILGARGIDLCARGLVRLAGRAADSPRRAAAFYLALPAALALLGGWDQVRRARALTHVYDAYERRLEMQMRDYMPLVRSVVPAGSKVAAYYPSIEALADVTWLALPAEGPAGIVEYCRKRGADFLFVRDSDGYFLGYTIEDIARIPGCERAVLNREFSGERHALFEIGSP